MHPPQTEHHFPNVCLFSPAEKAVPGAGGRQEAHPHKEDAAFVNAQPLPDAIPQEEASIVHRHFGRRAPLECKPLGDAIAQADEDVGVSGVSFKYVSAGLPTGIWCACSRVGALATRDDCAAAHAALPLVRHINMPQINDAALTRLSSHSTGMTRAGGLTIRSIHCEAGAFAHTPDNMS